MDWAIVWKYLYRVLPEILEAAPVVEMVAGEEVTLAAAVLVAGKKSCSRSSDSSGRKAKKIRRSMLVVVPCASVFILIDSASDVAGRSRAVVVAATAEVL